MKLVTKISLAALAILLALPTFAQQKHDLNGIKSIQLNIACQLVMVQGTSPNMEIVGDKNAIDDIEIERSGDRITLTSDRRNQEKEDVVVKIEVNDIDFLGIGGVVDMKTVHKLVFDSFKLSVSGVGNIEMALEVQKFDLKCSGVADVELKGKANEAELNISGVGKIDALGFTIKNADVSNSGVGRVYVNVSDNLDANVSGLGSIKYEGNPRVDANVSGLGKISQY
jgi:hypothetical protein